MVSNALELLAETIAVTNDRLDELATGSDEELDRRPDVITGIQSSSELVTTIRVPVKPPSVPLLQPPAMPCAVTPT
jgi:hypothetical protein